MTQLPPVRKPPPVARAATPAADPTSDGPPGGKTTLVGVAGALASLATLTALQLLGSDAFRDLSDPVKVAVVRSVGAIPGVGVAVFVGGQALVAACRTLAAAVSDVAAVWREQGGGRLRVAQLQAELAAERAKALVEVRRWRNGYAAERQKREYAETLIPGLKNAGPTVPNTTHPKEVSR